MARVRVAMQPWGTLFTTDGSASSGGGLKLKIPQAGQLASINTTVYAAAAGSATISAPAFITDLNGALPGYVDEGSWTLQAGGLSWPVEAVNAGSVLDLQEGRVTVAPYNAERTGLTDATASFNARLAVGSAHIPEGTYKILGNVQIPLARDFEGIGSGAVRFVMGPNGRISRGERTVANTTDGGVTAGFTVDGNSAATLGLYVGCVVNHKFADLRVEKCAGTCVLVEVGQNNLFEACTFWFAGGDALVLDYGAGGNTFDRCEIGVASGWNLTFRQSGAQPTSGGVPIGYADTYGPSSNTFKDCGIEYMGASTLAASIADGRGGSQGIVQHLAGYLNTFNNRTFISQGEAATTAKPCVKIAVGRVGTLSTELVFDDVWVFGTAGLATGLEMDGASRVTIRGRSVLQSMATAYRTRANDLVVLEAEPALLGVTTEWAQVVGDTPTAYLRNVVKSKQGEPTEHAVGTTGEPAFAANWANHGGGYETARFYLDGMGVVHLSGMVATTGAVATGAAIFTLPRGYWPGGAISGDKVAGGLGVLVDVFGVVRWYGAALASGVFISLNGIQFKAAQ